MERPDDHVDDQHIRIRGYTEGIDSVWVRLSWFEINMVYCFTRRGVNCNRGEKLLETGSFRVNVSDIFSNLEGGVGGGINSLVLLIQIGSEMDISRGDGVLSIFSLRQTPEEYVVVREPPVVGVGAV